MQGSAPPLILGDLDGIGDEGTQPVLPFGIDRSVIAQVLRESEHLLVRGGWQGRCSDVGVDDQEVDAVGADIEDC
jgi:hypothetical protein